MTDHTEPSGADRQQGSLSCHECGQQLIAFEPRQEGPGFIVHIRGDLTLELLDPDTGLGVIDCPACGHANPADFARLGWWFTHPA